MGERDWNALGKTQGKTDISLNKKGGFQAEEACQYLMKDNWHVLIISPLKGAKKTAGIINKDPNIPLVDRDEFLQLRSEVFLMKNRNYTMIFIPVFSLAFTIVYSLIFSLLLDFPMSILVGIALGISSGLPLGTAVSNGFNHDDSNDS